MAIGWGDQEMHRQTGASPEQGMDAKATQQGTRMVGRSMTSSGIRIASAPSQNGSTIDNQITRSHQTAAHAPPDGQHKEGLKGRRSCRRPSFAQLRRARHARQALGGQRQATGQGGPTLEPLVYILVGESKDAF